MKKYIKMFAVLLVVGILAGCSFLEDDTTPPTSSDYRLTDSSLTYFEQAMQIVDNQADGVIVIAIST